MEKYSKKERDATGFAVYNRKTYWLANYLRLGGFPTTHLQEYSQDEVYTIVRDIYNSAIFSDIVKRNQICSQVSEAGEMFENDYDKFVNVSVFQNACCMCIIQIGELCKVVSEELRTTENEIP